ncbi:serine hydroxymethyltransferase [Candidatus Nomurabacteria bacterium RIFCSPHIGHO2_02_FULL_38_15]|uniref:Serine hydroxymethyltransferase n=1 Tax=Candidatus Nomurabacteria bacterium RIFCSPHIGHO2_02_FULL_38_15 TaxID=1801752 RepID=A0A1F6VPT6_9BACT|nr:MAG: serine hydroxymethyltransferase [Candidatus Nomurabacteria bacterium RIFCSPHIGHO2_02_FULL_38_15]
MKDKQVAKILKQESLRQKGVINLIASENYVSKDVLEALGSELTNKYAEGYSKFRYYGGNEFVDKLDDLCKSRALKLFKLKSSEWAVNIQALSGSPANLAVIFGLVPVGGKIMGMELAHGGHLTHGHRVSITGKIWKQIPYGVDKKTEVLDYNEVKKIALKEKPQIIIAGYTAYPRIIDWKKFREIADVCGATLVVDMSHIAGLVAGGVYPSPFPYADVVTSTTHKTLRGPRSALIFSKIDERNLSKKIDQAVFPGIQGGPHMNQIAAVAVALEEAKNPEFKRYVKQVVKNTKVLGDEMKKLGWRIISNGTDSHLILIDIFGTIGMGGKEASDILEYNNIIVNKNTIPFDMRSPIDPSGIRIGTAAETTRGKKEKDMIVIAKKINQILRNKK